MYSHGKKSYLAICEQSEFKEECMSAPTLLRIQPSESIEIDPSYVESEAINASRAY